MQRGKVGDSSVLSMVAVHSSETSVNLSQTTRRHIPEVGNLYRLMWVVIMYNGGCEKSRFKGTPLLLHYVAISYFWCGIFIKTFMRFFNDQKLFVYTTGFVVSPK
jgi:hypothetical protein